MYETVTGVFFLEENENEYENEYENESVSLKVNYFYTYSIIWCFVNSRANLKYKFNPELACIFFLLLPMYISHHEILLVKNATASYAQNYFFPPEEPEGAVYELYPVPEL